MRRTRHTVPTALGQISALLRRIKRKDVQVFVVCLLIASVLWVFNSLRKERTEQISYPIEFEYDREQYIALKPFPDRLNINIKGSGWQILRKIFRVRIKPVRYVINPDLHISQPYLLAGQLRRDLLKVLQNVRLEEILTDTLKISIDRKFRRVLTIKIDSQRVDLATNYRITSPISITPNLIAFTGPESFIKSLPNPLYLRLPSDKISQYFQQEVKIDVPKYPDNLITKDEEFIEVKFEVAPYATQRMEVQVERYNFPEKSRFYIDKNQRKISITYSCKRDMASSVKPDQFKFVADFKTFSDGDSTVAVKLHYKPKDIKAEDIIFPPRIKISYAR
jgi:YbbR domain-containing protein